MTRSVSRCFSRFYSVETAVLCAIEGGGRVPTTPPTCYSQHFYVHIYMVFELLISIYRNKIISAELIARFRRLILFPTIINSIYSPHKHAITEFVTSRNMALSGDSAVVLVLRTIKNTNERTPHYINQIFLLITIDPALLCSTILNAK
jgi:hypothetical protein